MADLTTKIFDTLAGQTEKMLSNYDSPKRSFAFFTPYKSVSDVSLRSASVITAPVLFTVISASAAFVAAWELTKSLGYLMVLNTTSSEKELANFVEKAVISLSALAIAIASPAINLVDVIGGGINSIFGKSSAASSAGNNISKTHRGTDECPESEAQTSLSSAAV